MTSVRLLSLAFVSGSASAVDVLPGLAIPAAPGLPEIKPYDCDAEADIWEWAWTPDWKAWCCAHESKGCPSTSTVTTTTPLSTATKTITDTSTVTSTVTQTHTTRATVTETSTSTLASTVTETQTNTKTRTATSTSILATTEMPAVHTTQQTTPAPATEQTTPPAKPVESPKPHLEKVAAKPETAATTKQTTEATTKQSTESTTKATVASTTSLSTTPEPEVAESEPNDGCNAECVILGESATCQSRISWVEKHQTQGESAPCPAAHVVVMSQCESCGLCMFKDVKCASSAGVSKSLGEHTFMYRKYLEEPAGAVDAPEQHRGLPWVLSMCIVPLIAMGAISWRRRRSDAHLDPEEEWGVDASALAAE